MTDRHPFDCLLTPPDAAIAIGQWLAEFDPDDGPSMLDGEPILDPFAGAGTLLQWAVPGEELHAWEMDTRWGPELRQRVHPLHARLGRDSLAMEWMVRRGERPHILSNHPYVHTLAVVERTLDHARQHKRWVALLMRTDWWQHPGRDHLQPDFYLPLEWRPVFGLNKHGRFGTESGGSQWCVWLPEPSRGPVRARQLLRRPEVSDELRAEHRRLARMAHQWGRETAQGATP